MSFTLIWILHSFVSLSLFFLPCSFYFLWNSEVNPNWFWTQFSISSIYVPFVRFVLSSSFVSFSRSFLPFSFNCFNCPFCSAFLFIFLSWSSRCSNLAITLAITFCWKRNPGRDRLIWSQQEELNEKANRFSNLGQQVVLRLGKP